MDKAEKTPPVSRALRDTIRKRGLTAYAAAKRAGVSVDAVQRFLNGRRGLTLATVDRLAIALELTFCPEDRPRLGARNPHELPDGPVPGT